MSSVAYRDLQLAHGFHFPEINWLGQERVVISDWSSRLCCVDGADPSAIMYVDCRHEVMGTPAGDTLRSLVTVCEREGVSAVATTAAWAWIWRHTSGEPERLLAQGLAPVNAVGLDPDGSSLVLGLGWYPLSDKPAGAAVERWDLDGAARCTGTQRLPGVATDCVAFSPWGDVVGALSGARSQDRGFLILLDPANLQILELEETHHAMARGLLIDRERVVIVGRDRLDVRWLSDIHRTSDTLDLPGDWSRAALNPLDNTLLLSDGQLIDFDSFSARRLPMPEGRCGVCFGPDRSAYGVSEKGVLRRWELAGILGA